MKKVKIINKLGQEFGNITEDPTEWINSCVSNNSWGKPERWQLSSEPHDEADILENEERDILGTDPIQKETWVKLKAEYTIEIEDITEKLTKETRIAELKKLLSESDFRMTNDYFFEMSEIDKTFWSNSRSLWRKELRSLL
jgi:hypothetical protein